MLGVTAQRSSPPSFAPSPLLSHIGHGEIGSGDAAYLRVRVQGFVVEGSVRVAIVEPIERDGKPCVCDGRRQVYYVPAGHLVAAATVAREIKGE